MRLSGIYISLWEKYKAAIVSKLKSAVESPQEYQLSKHEFETFGRRPIAEYKFKLEIDNGKLMHMSNSVVARDLFEVLKQSPAAKELMNQHHFIIEMNTKFFLTIQVL